MGKSVYLFEEGSGLDKMLLGGKGAGMCEMVKIGLPVPPGFVITTEVCKRYYAAQERLPRGLMGEVRKAVKTLEKKTGKVFGSRSDPLLVSVRSGAAVSMPGMMDTVLNLGLNDATVEGLVRLTGNERFAYDTYRRFIQLFGKIVIGVKDEYFTGIFEKAKEKRGVKDDAALDAATLKEIVSKFKDVVRRGTEEEFPSDPYVQLEKAIAAVFKSWNGKRCVDYRREFKITPSIADGTAVTVMVMVFGNMGSDSATGVAFTRDAATGENMLYGEYLVNAQGEDVVAGIRTPKPIVELEKEIPEVFKEFRDIAERLERHYKEPQDLEFTIERGKLFMLQTRNAKMNAQAMVRTSVDMANERIISRKQAILRIDPEQLEQLLHARVDPRVGVAPLAKGLAASPGAASGKVVFDADRAEQLGKEGEKVILVREETKPEDVHGFFAAQAILTSRGGKTSHAAVVARGMGKPCVVGCSDIIIDQRQRLFSVGARSVREGEIITVDGGLGAVFLGEVAMVAPELPQELSTLLGWADDFRKLGVRGNADTPENAALSRKFGAEGIGLCRTERMFNAPKRLPVVQRMILADDREERLDAIMKLKPLQKEDFLKILEVMEGLPVTIRLLDPPLHEFLPSIEEIHVKPLDERTAAKVRALAETNPMLGHRGVRLGVTYPEIYEMQIRAICEAAAELIRRDVTVRPQIMVPQVCAAEELVVVKEIFDRVKTEVEKQFTVRLPLKFGTMMEVVRACLVADDIAEHADFFSFGTNDLTQGTFSFSREDAENKFLPLYTSAGILKENPFQTLDGSVAELMRRAVSLGRGKNMRLEVGICGEHGGDPNSIAICEGVGLDYVSCSPFRIPIARLAAAQSALKRKAEHGSGKTRLKGARRSK